MVVILLSALTLLLTAFKLVAVAFPSAVTAVVVAFAHALTTDNKFDCTLSYALVTLSIFESKLLYCVLICEPREVTNLVVLSEKDDTVLIVVSLLSLTIFFKASTLAKRPVLPDLPDGKFKKVNETWYDANMQALKEFEKRVDDEMEDRVFSDSMNATVMGLSPAQYNDILKPKE